MSAVVLCDGLSFVSSLAAWLPGVWELTHHQRQSLESPYGQTYWMFKGMALLCLPLIEYPMMSANEIMCPSDRIQVQLEIL